MLPRIRPLVVLAVLTPAASGQQFAGPLAVQPPSSAFLQGVALGNPIGLQGSGSLNTTYGGSVGVGSLNLSALQLSFDTAGTSAEAASSGSWEPTPGGGFGTAPANYGTRTTFTGTGGVLLTAIRGLRLTVEHAAPITLTPAGAGTYTFPTSQNVRIAAGTLDARANFGDIPGATDLTNRLTGNVSGSTGTLVDLGGGEFRLTYPFIAVYTVPLGGSGSMTFAVNGTLAGQGTLTPVPEVGLLLLLAGVPLVRRTPR